MVIRKVLMDVLMKNDAYNLLSENGTPRNNYGFGGNIKWKGITVDAFSGCWQI